MKNLTPKEELYAQAYIKHTGDKVKAYKTAGYSLKLTSPQMSTQADKIYNRPNVNLRIQSLQKKASIIANEKFSVSIEQRIKWLEEVAEAGLETIIDASGVSKKQNLASTCKAVEVLNNMLGTSEKGDSIKPVKIFVGVMDAS